MFPLPVTTINITKLIKDDSKGIAIDILRLDEIHAIISGNKWFKLQYYLNEAIAKKATVIATFGGPYSNHIVATAYAGKITGITTKGYIRGEQPRVLSHTLQHCVTYGMELQFLSRLAYDNLKKSTALGNEYVIPEGGYGMLGSNGASNIQQFIPPNYNTIICAVGSGTMIAGLCKTQQPGQSILGIVITKGNTSIVNEINTLLPLDKHQNYTLNNGYHFGGYAKHTQELLLFMQQINHTYQVPLDFVYTAKAFYGVMDLYKNNYFAEGSNILFIHSGGIQGNSSLENYKAKA